MQNSAVTQSVVHLQGLTPSSRDIVLLGVRPRSASRSNRQLENAVYAHVKAMRSLGRTRLNTAEIGKALGVSPALVLRAAKSLSKKGIKLALGLRSRT